MRMPVHQTFLVAAAVVAAMVPSAAWAAAPAAGDTATAGTSPQARSAASPVLLVNGVRLLVSPAPGGSAVAVLPGTAAGGLLGLRLGGLDEEIPDDALPYLGRGLDPSLFDVSALQRAEVGGRLPVRVTFPGTRPELPGVTVTSSGRGTAQGYLTVAGAQAFGAALEQQFSADQGVGSGLFGGGTDIELAGVPAPAPSARPDFPMHTLTVTATDLAGKPDNGDTAVVFDASSLAAFSDGAGNFSTFYHGVARFSVPSGRYWVIGQFDSATSASGTTRLDVLPEVEVAANTTAHVAESAATSKIMMATPRAATSQAVTFCAILGDPHGNTMSLQWFDAPGTVWVSPMSRKPATGTLQAYASGILTSPQTAAGAPYVYNLDYADAPGVIPAQRYPARPSALAAVTERYYQDTSSAGGWIDFGAFPDQGLVSWPFAPLDLPGTQVQYFSTAPDLVWNTAYYADAEGSNFPSGGQSDDAYRVLSPGVQVVDWNDYPLHPQPDVSAGGIGGRLIPLVPSAIRVGNTLSLTMAPFSDNVPGHLSGGPVSGATENASYYIDQNGVPISHGSADNGIPPVTLAAKASLIRFTLDAALTGTADPLSASTQTAWTWRSRPDPAATVPLSWYCTYTPSGHLLRRCAVQPLMTLGYHVHGLALTGTVPAGAQLIALQVGHLQLATPAHVTGASAQFSCDDGKSWQRASVRGEGGGNFQIAFSAPGGCLVTLRVAASDAAGGSITETITRAYQVAH